MWVALAVIPTGCSAILIPEVAPALVPAFMSPYLRQTSAGNSAAAAAPSAAPSAVPNDVPYKAIIDCGTLYGEGTVTLVTKDKDYKVTLRCPQPTSEIDRKLEQKKNGQRNI